MRNSRLRQENFSEMDGQLPLFETDGAALGTDEATLRTDATLRAEEATVQADEAALQAAEDPRFLKEQLITYIGNKRSLLAFIGNAVDEIRNRLGRGRLVVGDLFSGSGVVARYLKQYAKRLVVNDLEDYSWVINRCYLSNVGDLDIDRLRSEHQALTGRLRTEGLRDGVIARLYAPQDDESIRPGERVFYTKRNAQFLDTARQLIGELPPSRQPYFLAPLLAEASVHANTSGVFKGFYKSRETGIGRFGGHNGDALVRILGDIELPFPVFSRFESDVELHREDVNRLAPRLGHFDLVYLDPPYNQHPYGSNYFMLNLLVNYGDPGNISRVSGIPESWRRSEYNKRRKAIGAFSELVSALDTRYLLVSFNSEGFIRKDEMIDILSQVGEVEHMETSYNAFRGSRNLNARDIHVREYLFLVRKQGA